MKGGEIMNTEVYLKLKGRYEAIELKCRDAEGGMTFDVLDDSGRVLRVEYTPGHWTEGTWTTAPEWVDETLKVRVIAA